MAFGKADAISNAGYIVKKFCEGMAIVFILILSFGNGFQFRRIRDGVIGGGAFWVACQRVKANTETQT